MRSGHFDDVFDREEQDFLFELVESALPEARETLQAHIDAATLEEADDHIEMIERQRRRISFMEKLEDMLEEVNEDDDTD